MSIRIIEDVALREIDIITKLDNLLELLEGDEIMILLFLYEGMSQADIVRLTSMPQHTVKYRMEAIREKAKEVGIAP